MNINPLQATNYGPQPAVQALTGYGGQPPSAYLSQQQQQQQNVQTYYPFNSADNNNFPQPAPTPISSPQANIYSVPEQQPNQGYGGQPQQPDPVIYQPQPQQVVAPQQQVNNFNSYPQFPDPEPEASSQPTIDNTNLQQYAQYLDILQKQYGIKLPAAGGSPTSGSTIVVPNNMNEQQQNAAVQNPYAAAVQPQTQSHIQSQLQSSLQGIYPQQGAEHSWNPWQTNAQNNFNNQQQQQVKPIVTTYVPQQPPTAPQPQPQQPQIQIQQPQQQVVYGNNEVYQQPAPQPQPQQQPYYPTDFASSNTVVEPQPKQPQHPKPQPPSAPHIIFPSSIPIPQPRPQQPHVVVHPDVVPHTRPLPQQPKTPVYIQPTYPSILPSTTPLPPPPPQPSPTRSSLEYEREIVVATHPPPTIRAPAPTPTPSRPSSLPLTPSTTSIQALTQQIRRLPAVLYVDSRSPDARRTETLLRETYGLPLVAFYVDKIDKPKAVERHLHQLTAHKGLPYLFICGTFIGSQAHIDNYHANRQVPQLVEFVCSDEKKRKHKKKTSASKVAAAAATSAVVLN
uniref:Glutaredoxin domain-containing protein n=1 Tax=Panagrolaimus superbus TaxID=310955 RepID=A0A914Y1B0_9BILA